MDERFNIKSMVAVGYTFHYNAAVPDGQHQPLQPLTVCQHCLGRGLIAPAKKLHAALLTHGKGLCYFSGFLLKVKS